MSTTTSRRPLPWILQAPPIADLHAPAWFDRLPRWLSTGGVLLFLLVVSAVVRTRFIGGQFWTEEAMAVGIASHSLTAIPGLLRHEGSAPLYFIVLHIWMSLFGTTEAATHALSLLLGLIAVPIAMWAGWSLSGRRAGFYAATLFAFSAFLTQYAQETYIYELVAVTALVTTACFLHGFVFGRRRYLVGFALGLTLMLYTSFWAIFFWAGMAVALIWVLRGTEARATVRRDALLCFGVALLLFVPWLPTLIFQIRHDTSPFTYADFIGPTFPSALLGGDRVLSTLGLATAVGIVPLLARDRRATREATTMWTLLTITVAAMLCAGGLALIWPTWITRYLAPVVAPMLLLAAFASARGRVFGLAAIVISIAFVANTASFVAKDKSDMRDLAGELAPLLRPHDMVLVSDPEQTALAWYYLPAGLRYATMIGPVMDPRTMNWDNAYTRLRRANPRQTLAALLATLAPGQRLLVARPLTEGTAAWKNNWASLVRRRAAQWSALIAADPQLRVLAGAVAPHSYRGSCCVSDSALVYTKLG